MMFSPLRVRSVAYQSMLRTHIDIRMSEKVPFFWFAFNKRSDNIRSNGRVAVGSV